jgi:hypothetical protein
VLTIRRTFLVLQLTVYVKVSVLAADKVDVACILASLDIA